MKKSSEKIIYLTFDDGPHPEITPWVCDILKDFQAKATFFCVGNNVLKYPNVCVSVFKKGHRLGNHTQSHTKGWRLKNADYLSEIDLCNSSFRSVLGDLWLGQPKLFRPPYGQIKPSQIAPIKLLGYSIIQWSDLSCDYDKNLNCTKSLSALVKNTKPGSIVVFHDSKKAEHQLKWLLPKYLEAMTSKGFTFETL